MKWIWPVAREGGVGRLLVPLVLLVLPLVAPAQAVRPLGGAVDLGFAAASGNTDVTTFSLNEKLTWRAKPRLVVRQQLRSTYGQADDKVNASLFDFEASGDYSFLFNGFGLTVGAGFDRNRFAGIARRHEQSIGVSWRATTASHDSVRFTGVVLWTQQRNTQDQRREFVAFRASLMYRHPLGSGAYVQQAMEAIPNIETREDWRFNSETTLVAPLTKHVGLRMTYVLRYDHLPETTFQTTDRILTTGFQITF